MSSFLPKPKPKPTAEETVDKQVGIWCALREKENLDQGRTETKEQLLSTIMSTPEYQALLISSEDPNNPIHNDLLLGVVSTPTLPTIPPTATKPINASTLIAKLLTSKPYTSEMIDNFKPIFQAIHHNQLTKYELITAIGAPINLEFGKQLQAIYYDNKLEKGCHTNHFTETINHLYFAFMLCWNDKKKNEHGGISFKRNYSMGMFGGICILPEWYLVMLADGE